ncbi:type II methionyl aminopeptidase [Archaeoglobus neptunius]|uniref:type II methionyl aminopeptidase n=1 Tax=Archaeoglobus neptunius TaxID=2798580 RepID=UPI001926A4D5|nr:type II methionyl aminopeptidase [Archaeoglobus neptunius]
MDEEVREKLLEAGKILKQAVSEASEKIAPGVRILEVAEFVENRIIELGAKPAFPANISINSDAAHFTPKKNDNRVFNDGDVVKLDVGAHIDGYIADMAVTVDLGDNRELVAASRDALDAAIEVVEAGVSVSKIGKAIEDAIKSHGFKPIVNLTGHGLLPYLTHAPPSIYNYATERGVELKEGMVIAIEPFATDGVGKVADRNECEIYSLLNPRPVRMKMAREIVKEVNERYKTLPFAKRWLNKAPEIIISRLAREGILRAYPVLTEVSGGLVSQWEHTLIVEEGGATITTR